MDPKSPPVTGPERPEDDRTSHVASAIVSCVVTKRNDFQTTLKQLAAGLKCPTNWQLISSRQLSDFFEKFWLGLAESVRSVLVTLVLAAEFDRNQGKHKLVDGSGEEIDLSDVYKWVNHPAFRPKGCTALLLVQGAVGSDPPPHQLLECEQADGDTTGDDTTDSSPKLPLRPLFADLLISQVFTENEDKMCVYLQSFMEVAHNNRNEHCAKVFNELHQQLDSKGINASYIVSSLGTVAPFVLEVSAPFVSSTDEFESILLGSQSADLNLKALLIANEQFKKENYNIGGCVLQMTNLQKALRKFNVEANIETNLKAEDMERVISEFGGGDGCVRLVVIMTHGGDGGLYGSDLVRVSESVLFSPLDNETPKVIIVNACSGSCVHGYVDGKMLMRAAKVFEENAQMLKSTIYDPSQGDEPLAPGTLKNMETVAKALDKMASMATAMAKGEGGVDVDEFSECVKKAEKFFTNNTKDTLPFVDDVLSGRRRVCVECTPAEECQRLLPPRLLLPNVLILRTATPGCSSNARPGTDAPSKILERFITTIENEESPIRISWLLLKLKDLNNEQHFDSGTVHTVETYFWDDLFFSKARDSPDST